MAGVGRRFELDELRREAQAEKKAAQTRAIIQNATMVVVVIAVIICGKVGWDKWQAKREADRQAAEAAERASERAAAERKKAEAERKKAEAEKRAAEKKAEEEKREAEKRAREEARIAERQAREEERIRKEEERREAERLRIEQQDRRKYVDKVVADLSFDIEGRVTYEYGLDEFVDASVNEERWTELATLAKKGNAIDLLESLRGTTVTNSFSEERYPDNQTVASLLENLKAERFTLVLRLKDDARTRTRLVLVTPDEENGLAEPEGARQLTTGKRVTGWTIPFDYGDPMQLFLMTQASANKFATEWATRRRKLLGEAAKLSNRNEYVAERMKRDLPDFIGSVKIELATPPPPPETAADTSAKGTSSRTSRTTTAKDDDKRTQQKTGLNSDIRTMRNGRQFNDTNYRNNNNRNNNNNRYNNNRYNNNNRR